MPTKIKLHTIFLTILVIEIVGCLVFYLLGSEKWCGTEYSFFNPFGFGEVDKQREYCTYGGYVPHPLFWITADVLILTVSVYLITLVVSRFKKVIP